MSQSNRRVQQSVSLMGDALIALMEEKAFTDIRISEICKRATVSRNTFYRQFSGKEDLLSRILEEKTGYIIHQFLLLEDYDLSRPTEKDAIRTFERFYRFWFGQQKLLEILHRQGLLWVLDRAFLRTVPAYGEKSYEELSVSLDPECFADYFYFWHAMSMSKIIEKWVQRGCRESVEELVTVTIRLHQTMNFQWGAPGDKRV